MDISSVIDRMSNPETILRDSRLRRTVLTLGAPDPFVQVEYQRASFLKVMECSGCSARGTKDASLSRQAGHAKKHGICA
jgi:hypothetical protein